MQINTSNPELITYQDEELAILILGGIKISGLDRMKVTLKFERKEEYPLRYSVDLYNPVQVGKLIEKVREHYELEEDYLIDLFNQLTNELEKYRFEIMESLSASTRKEKYITNGEKREAVEFLSRSSLMKDTQERIGLLMAGEPINRLLMYLVFTSRKTPNPLHLICFGISGEGKSHLQESVGQLIPDEDKLEITSITKNALYYFKDQDLDKKVLLLEDIDGVESALFPLRELQSKKQLTKSLTVKDPTGQLKTVIHSVKGNVTIVGATTRENIYEDNSNRSLLIHLDTSPEQDQRIIQYQRDLFSGKIDKGLIDQTKEIFSNMQRVLVPVRIVNPFSDQISLPPFIKTPRRAMRIYLSLIETITFYHQYQRRKFKDESGHYIKTTKEDITWANVLLKESLLQRNDELSSGCRSFYNQIKSKYKTFTTREIKADFRINQSTLKKYIKRLMEEDYLRIKSGDKHKGFSYELLSEVPNERRREELKEVLEQMN
ncbi:MAG: hypothetical protein ABJG78_12415 [Cyclobacteriaceae bacterium]